MPGRLLALLLGLGLGLAFPAALEGQADSPVVVASKPFGESYLLGEIFAQQLEARGFQVERRLGLGATELTFQALRQGSVDVYPEYTGTGLLAILGEAPQGSPAQVFRRVATVFQERWGVGWLAPLGFENSYAVAVRRETAEALELRTLSDLARAGAELRGGFSPDFLGRADGLPGLARAYGMELAQTRSLLQAVKYEALASGDVDVIDGYSTDGFIVRYDLVVLEDDRGFFPPYQAAPLVGRAVMDHRPDVQAALGELAGRLDDELMRRLNRRLEVDGAPLAEVAREARNAMGLLGGAEGAFPSRAESTVAPTLRAYLWERRQTLVQQTLRHLLLVSVSLGSAILVALPLGLLLERARGGAEGVIRGVGVLQTLPSIALLAFMIPLLGIGVLPALVALFLYSLYPILRNTYSGVRDADPVAVEAARALGMTPGQLLTQVRLPLAAPVIMAGIRTAAVLNVGTATLAAFIGAGGLGDPIVSGLALADSRMILSGAIPAALLAVLVDGALALAERVVRPGGVQAEHGWDLME
ncbi:MAG: glycine betaine ABC transporter substrate-binding protein [Gemmatimonadota bacterium]